MESSPVKERLDSALEMAAEAAEFILSHYQNADLQVDRKRDSSPVTVADRGAEELIRRRIAEKYPDDAILGEEFPEKAGTSGYRWILDPVDGTKSFIHGVPLFGTLIGIECEGTCVAGVCGFPALNEVVYAAKGFGAWWKIGDREPRPAKVSSIADFGEAAFCTTTMTRWEKIGKTEAFNFLLRNSGLSRGWGDCYGHILVATGRIEVMVDPSLNPWDCAALLPIMEEAGGHFVDFQGNASIYSGQGLSVNNALKNEVLRIVGER